MAMCTPSRPPTASATRCVFSVGQDSASRLLTSVAQLVEPLPAGVAAGSWRLPRAKLTAAACVKLPWLCRCA